MTTQKDSTRSPVRHTILLSCLAAAAVLVAGCTSRAAAPDTMTVELQEASDEGESHAAHGGAESHAGPDDAGSHGAHAGAHDKHDDHHAEDKGDGGYIGDAEGPFERGAPLSISEDEATALAEIVADPAAFVDRVVRVDGVAASVCERRGCWFVLEAEGVEEPVRIRFLDYAFFIPKDAAGRKVSLEATVEVRTLTPERQVHYAEHVGETLDEESLEDRDEVTLIARGLLVY